MSDDRPWRRWLRPPDNRYSQWHLSGPGVTYLCRPTTKLPRTAGQPDVEQSDDPPADERCKGCERARTATPVPASGMRGKAPTLHCARHGWYTTSTRRCPVSGCESADTGKRQACPRITIPADLLAVAAERAAVERVPTRWLLAELLASALRKIKPE